MQDNDFLLIQSQYHFHIMAYASPIKSHKGFIQTFRAIAHKLLGEFIFQV